MAQLLISLFITKIVGAPYLRLRSGQVPSARLPLNSRSLDSVIEFPREFDHGARDDSSVVGFAARLKAVPFPLIPLLSNPALRK